MTNHNSDKTMLKNLLKVAMLLKQAKQQKDDECETSLLSPTAKSLPSSQSITSKKGNPKDEQEK